MYRLLHKPRVLFLDEPTNGVDPVSRRDFGPSFINWYATDSHVMVTTAYLDSEAERANRVGFMTPEASDQVDTPQD
jgi:ABC-2 type transport system ATP-binding protein